MRIIFIAGLGEDDFIFDRIRDSLPGEKLFLNLWQELPEHPVRNINVTDFARSLIQRYNILSENLVIGHSTGGWVALHVKQAIGCPVIQLASWTDPEKINVPVRNRYLLYFAAKAGFVFNLPVLRYSLRKNYEGLPSRDIYERIFMRLITGNITNAVNQLRIIFNPVRQAATVLPDLRIHAKADGVIRYPDGPVYEVQGDHFSLYTYPEQVLVPIYHFLHFRYENF